MEEKLKRKNTMKTRNEAVYKLENNLFNISFEDPIYKVFMRNLKYYLPDELKELYEENYYVQVIATDNFFLHYSVVPILAPSNKDSLMETVRIFLQKYIQSDLYRKVRVNTILDEDTSIIHTISLTKTLLEELYKKGNKSGSKDSKTTNEKRMKENMQSSKPGEKNEGKKKGMEQSVKNGIQDKNKPSKEPTKDLSLRINEAMEKATENAGKMAKMSKTIKELVGLGGSSLEKGNIMKIIDLSSSILPVKDAQAIIELAKATLEHMPRSYKRKKEINKYGDEIKGYYNTKNIEKIIPRELALPDEIFMAKIGSTGFLAREKESPKEGALYVLLDKCIPVFSPILLHNNEEIPIGDVKEGQKVKSAFIKGFVGSRRLFVPIEKSHGIAESTATIKKVVKGGKKKIFKIKTLDGELYASSNHILPVIRGSSLIEVPVGQLLVGDKIYKHVSNKNAENNFIPSTVTSIEEWGIEDTVDLILEGPHYFITNGFVVHNSGSMNGYKLIWSRSVALALYHLAKMKDRVFMLRMFDSNIYPEEHPYTNPIEILEAILKMPSNGGTRITKSVKKAVEDIIERNLNKKTNTIVLVTDGEDQVLLDKELLKRNNITLISIMVGGDNETLKNISDHYLNAALDLDGALKIIKITEETLPTRLMKSRYRHN